MCMNKYPCTVLQTIRAIVIRDAGFLIISCTTFDKCFEVFVYSNWDFQMLTLTAMKWLRSVWKLGISSDISSWVGAYFVKWFIFPIFGRQNKNDWLYFRKISIKQNALPLSGAFYYSFVSQSSTRKTRTKRQVVTCVVVKESTVVNWFMILNNRIKVSITFLRKQKNEVDYYHLNSLQTKPENTSISRILDPAILRVFF